MSLQYAESDPLVHVAQYGQLLEGTTQIALKAMLLLENGCQEYS